MIITGIEKGRVKVCTWKCHCTSDENVCGTIDGLTPKRTGVYIRLNVLVDNIQMVVCARPACRNKSSTEIVEPVPVLQGGRGHDIRPNWHIMQNQSQSIGSATQNAMKHSMGREEMRREERRGKDK